MNEKRAVELLMERLDADAELTEHTAVIKIRLLSVAWRSGCGISSRASINEIVDLLMETGYTLEELEPLFLEG